MLSKGKVIGSNLEAAVKIVVPDTPQYRELMSDRETVGEFLILSDFTHSFLPVMPVAGATMGFFSKATATKTSFQKCQRCWRHLPDVGIHAAYPALCGRCADVLGG